MSDYPSISEPTPDPLVLHKVALELKEAVEIVTGQRGLPEQSIDGRIARIEADIEAILGRMRAAGI